MSLFTSKLALSILALIVTVLVVLYAIGKKSVHHEIIIPTSPENVWQVLISTDQYPEWNPVIVAAEGALQPGQKMKYTFRQSEDTEYAVPVTVKAMEPGKLLNQVGGTIGILTYNHRYTMEEVTEGTKVTIHEEYRGIAVPFWNPSAVADAYGRLNEALRDRSIAITE